MLLTGCQLQAVLPLVSHASMPTPLCLRCCWEGFLRHSPGSGLEQRRQGQGHVLFLCFLSPYLITVKLNCHFLTQAKPESNNLILSRENFCHFTCQLLLALIPQTSSIIFEIAIVFPLQKIAEVPQEQKLQGSYHEIAFTSKMISSAPTRLRAC